jgi:pimeloyl-ACP methyl ester carboxylesterase
MRMNLRRHDPGALFSRFALAARRFRGPSLVLALAVFASMLMGARCYPPGTRVIVFVQGYYTTYDANGTQASIVEGQRFNVLKNEFAAKGYARTSLLDFSYAGGAVRQDGTWSPDPYPCELTDRRSDDNLIPLETMLRDYGAHHPNAHFTLVGHSLGGFLVFLEGAREAGRTPAAKLGIDAVVTLDAPLKGASPDKKLVLDIDPCGKTYLAGGEIVAEKLDPTTPDRRQREAQAMAQQGIRLATFGNLRDCLWNPAICVPALPWVDDSDTQVLPGDAAVSQMYSIESVPLASHDIILANAASSGAVVAFVSAP